MLIIDSGNCWITVETAGPAPVFIGHVTPDDLKSSAAWIIKRCVRGRTDRAQIGHGGFLTLSLTRLMGYVLNPGTNVLKYR